MTHLPLGPLMIDIAGTALTDLDRERLCHPLVGGIILFTRNFADLGQLSALTAEIHALRTPQLLIAVDHEGGRVQRFREGFPVGQAGRDSRRARRGTLSIHRGREDGVHVIADVRPAPLPLKANALARVPGGWRGAADPRSEGQAYSTGGTKPK